MKWLGLLLVAGAAASGQDAGIGRTLLGYTDDTRPGVLREVLGIPGAATLGLTLDAGYSNAALAPGRQYAIGVRDGRGYRLALPALTEMAFTSSGWDLAAFSPSGEEAALYEAATATLRVFRGLPGAPSLAWEQVLPGELVVRALTVAPEGAAVFVSSPTAVWRADEAGLREWAAADDDPRTAVSGSDVWVTARGRGAVERIDANGSLAGSFDVAASGVAQPSFVASLPGGRVVTGDTGSGALALIDTNGEVRPWLRCACSPDRFERFNSGRLYALTSGAAGPLWLVDLDGDEPALFFVPAGDGQ